MRSIKQVRQRIKAAKNIQQITRAMKLVAGARFKRSQDKVLQARPYAGKMRELMSNLAMASELPPHPLLERRNPIRRIAAIVITSDRGLCGSYNTNVLRKAVETLSEYPKDAVDIISVGKKADQFLRRRDFNVLHNVSLPNTGPTIAEATTITRLSCEMFESGQVDSVLIIYARFQSALIQFPSSAQLLPIVPPEAETVTHREYLFEPEPQKLLGSLLPRYVFNQVYQTLLEANASEHGARMTAMTSATDNAGKIIQELTLTANRARQAAITKEILEVVSGAEALRG